MMNTRAPERQRTTGFWVLFATILASSMAFIDGTALNVALPVIQADLGASGGELLWIINSYLLMLAALILVGGALGDRLGRRRAFAAGITLFLFASLACGLAPSTGALIAARTFQGLGGALMIPGSLALISATFGASERGQAIGTWSAISTLVTLAGPLLGGVLADAGLWRGIFLINLPIGIMALAALLLRVPESRGEQPTGPLDYPGALLTMLGLAALTYGFLSAPELGYSDTRVWGALAIGVAALVAFVLVEWRSSAPMVPLRLFRSHTFSGANLLTLFLYGALAVGPFFLSLNLVQIQGYSPTLAGLAFTPFALLLSLLSRRAGALADRFGPRPVLIAGPLIAGFGFLLLGLVGVTGGAAGYWTSFFPGVVVLGLGMAITVAPLSAAVMGAVDTRFSGTASGINNAVSRVAGVLAIAIVGALALGLFSGALEQRSAGLGLGDSARTALVAQAPRLGEAQVPEEVAPALVPATLEAIRFAFIDAYRAVLLICAALAWLSALSAGLLLRPGEPVAE